MGGGRRSLVVEIGAVLALAGLAPVALSFFLLRSNENALEDQVLRTHLIASSTTADRVASFLQPFQDLARSLGESLVLIDDPFVTEAQDISSTLYSESRMVEIFDQRASFDPEEIVGTIFSDVLEFQGATEQADDITLLGLRYKGAPETVS